MLIWYPKVTCGPSVFVQYGITGRPLPTQAGAGTFFNTGSIVLNTANTNTGFEQYY